MDSELVQAITELLEVLIEYFGPAAQLRELRIINLKDRGWPDEDIERLLLTNDFSSVIEARNELEKREKLVIIRYELGSYFIHNFNSITL